MSVCVCVCDYMYQQSRILFELFGLEPKYIRVPVAVFDAIIGAIDLAAVLFPKCDTLTNYTN